MAFLFIIKKCGHVTHVKLATLMRTAFLFLIGLFLSGCQTSNFWEQYYQGQEVPAKYTYSGKTVCSPGNAEACKNLIRDGFLCFGESNFRASGDVALEGLQKMGEKVGADVVVYAVDNERSTQGASIVPIYHPGAVSTTYANGFGSAYGTYGSATANYYGTATTYNSGTYSSAVVPTTIVQRDYHAVFFRKGSEKRILGLMVKPLEQSEVTKLGTNNAVCVDLVLRGSPASTSDIFEGDFILEINGQKINSPMDYYKLIEKLEGQKISLLLMRGGSRMSKEVQLNILK